VKILFPADGSSSTLGKLFEDAAADIVFLGDTRATILPGPRMFERMSQVLQDCGAGIVYADGVDHPRTDYQLGSIRDTFDFGPLLAVSVPAAREAKLGDEWRWGGLYDLRLRISEKHPIIRVPEPLYSASGTDSRPSGQRQFDYVDSRNRNYQIEMEQIATAHLKRIGAYLEPEFRNVPPVSDSFPLKASVVIPVRNRERTIIDAVQSALSQKADFAFNVIVVNNHSTDQTAELLKHVSDPRLIQVVPDRRDLAIGGCWNEAIYSTHCGRYAVQLDSDDVYRDETILSRLIRKLESAPYGMVVGSYTIVDFSLHEIPPGLIDHREWTRENGRNNALRINGLGAPRAFDVSVLRRIGFPNVSYGEDYAVGLRITRDYEMGRIYDSIYLCRRWEGNTDTALPLEAANRYDAYKDWIRTGEILARQSANGRRHRATF
jgi:hypothetical protein